MRADVLRSLVAVLIVIAVFALPRPAPRSAALPDPSAGSAIPTALDSFRRISVSGEWDDAALRSGAPTVRDASPLPSQPPSKRDEPGEMAGATILVGPSPTAPLTPKVRAAASPLPKVQARRPAVAPKPATCNSACIVRTGLATTYGEGWSEWWVALPDGPGWRFRVCGAGGCRELVSHDAGPDLASQRRGRIVDLPIGAFEYVCGVSWRMGLCPVGITLLGRAR